MLWSDVPADVVVVETPGTEPSAWRALLEALRRDGHTPRVVAFPCSGDSTSFAAEIRRSVPNAPYVLVAHGLGATLALQADLHPTRWVLLGPVLGPADSVALERLAAQPVDAKVSLDADSPLAVALGVAGVDLRCVAAGLAREVEDWIKSQAVPVDPAAVREPVIVASGPLDEIAPVETLVPESRRFADHRLVRLGLGRLDPVDPDHAGLLTLRSSIATAVRAVDGGLDPTLPPPESTPR